MKLGVEPADVNQTLGSFLGGAYVNDFNRFGRLYKVYVQAETEYRQELSDSSLFYVRNKDGDMVPLATLITSEPTAGPEFTYRFNLHEGQENGSIGKCPVFIEGGSIYLRYLYLFHDTILDFCAKCWQFRSVAVNYLCKNV